MGNKYGRVAEDVAGLALGNVVYYNGENSRKVLENLSNPTGMSVVSCRNSSAAEQNEYLIVG